jgi:hypothetical protein
MLEIAESHLLWNSSFNIGLGLYTPRVFNFICSGRELRRYVFLSGTTYTVSPGLVILIISKRTWRFSTSRRGAKRLLCKSDVKVFRLAVETADKLPPGAVPTQREPRKSFQGGFYAFFIYCTFFNPAHPCCPSDSIGSEDVGIEPRAVATLALTVNYVIEEPILITKCKFYKHNTVY